MPRKEKILRYVICSIKTREGIKRVEDQKKKKKKNTRAMNRKQLQVWYILIQLYQCSL